MVWGDGRNTTQKLRVLFLFYYNKLLLGVKEEKKIFNGLVTEFFFFEVTKQS